MSEINQDRFFESSTHAGNAAEHFDGLSAAATWWIPGYGAFGRGKAIFHSRISSRAISFVIEDINQSNDCFISTARINCDAGKRSHLCETSVHEQFNPGDVAAVIGCEKHHSPRYFSTLGEAAEWNRHLKSSLSVAVRLPTIRPAHSGPTYPSRQGSRRSHECAGPSNPLSKSVQRNAPQPWLPYKRYSRVALCYRRSTRSG